MRAPRKPPRSLEDNVQFLRKRFYVSNSSPSGLRMRTPNLAKNPKVIRKEHDVAGRVNTTGYWEVGANGAYAKVSRVIWILVNGPIPYGMIVDHKDGNQLNNNLSNLQLLSRPQNTRALNSPYSCNKTGFLGVFKRTDGNGWYAAMRRFGKLHYLGAFSNPKFAAKAYNDAVISWAEAHGETPRYLNPV